MRISDWSSDVCSSDLGRGRADRPHQRAARRLTMSRRRHHERKPDAAPADVDRKPGGPLDPFAILVEYERKSLAHVAGLPEQLDAPGLWRDRKSTRLNSSH